MARPNREKYAQMFQSRTNKGNAIKSIQVQEMDNIAAMKIALTLWDDTLMTSSLPGWFCTSENKEFIFYYVDEVLAPALTGHDPLKQATIDKILDRLVANADISLEELKELATNVNWAVSVAVCKAGAHYKKKSAYMYVAELAANQDDDHDFEFDPEFIAPTPYLDVASGGSSLKRLADRHLVISQLEPRSFNDATRVIQRVFDEYSEIDVDTTIDDGDEESYTPNIKKIKKSLSSLEKLLANLGLQDEVLMGVNIGASKFFVHDKKTYSFNLSEENSDNSDEMSAEDLFKAYISLWREFPRLAAFEDMFHVDDDKEYPSKFTRGVIGGFVIAELKCDDYDEAMINEVCKSLHLKVGRIGSVTKCIGFVRNAKCEQWSTILSSHDSCETSEPFLADFCVGLSVDLIKIGVSCFTSACNICNRVRELEVERAKELWRSCPKCRGQEISAWFRNESPQEEKHKTCCGEAANKIRFKEQGLHGY